MKKIRKEFENKPKAITEALLWEWKYQLNSVKLATINRDRARLTRDLMAKEKEILDLKIKLFKKTIDSCTVLEAAAKEEYEKVKEKLEIFIGFPVEECVIDDETLEVKRVNELQAKVD